jgi:protein-L-isoaspartate(D-aspartate) O-methyltransferase
MKALRRERSEMVQQQLERQGVRDPRVLAAMESIPRHRFVPPEFWDHAYQPRAVSIGAGQTISQPFMVGMMTQKLELAGHERVLEIGTGSGYQAAILGALSEHVVTLERILSLAVMARRALLELGSPNVDVVVADGSRGAPMRGSFDRILVTAAAPRLPESLLEQLADPGILLCPVGSWDLQRVVRVVRRDGIDRQDESLPCRFVPLLGEQGFPRR